MNRDSMSNRGDAGNFERREERDPWNSSQQSGGYPQPRRSAPEQPNGETRQTYFRPRRSANASADDQNQRDTASSYPAPTSSGRQIDHSAMNQQQPPYQPRPRRQNYDAPYDNSGNRAGYNQRQDYNAAPDYDYQPPFDDEMEDRWNREGANFSRFGAQSGAGYGGGKPYQRPQNYRPQQPKPAPPQQPQPPRYQQPYNEAPQGRGNYPPQQNPNYGQQQPYYNPQNPNFNPQRNPNYNPNYRQQKPGYQQQQPNRNYGGGGYNQPPQQGGKNYQQFQPQGRPAGKPPYQQRSGNNPPPYQQQQQQPPQRRTFNNTNFQGGNNNPRNAGFQKQGPPPQPSAKAKQFSFPPAQGPTVNYQHRTKPQALQPKIKKRKGPLSISIISLPRALTRYQFASRKLAIEHIKNGRVYVNNNIVTDPNLRVTYRRDKIRVDLLPMSLNREMTYIVINKPQNISGSKEESTVSIHSYVQHTESWFCPSGRLDKSCSGLVVMTNDPDHKNPDTTTFNELEKEYHIKVNTLPAEEDLAKITEKLRALHPINGEETSVTVKEKNSRHGWLTVIVKRAKLAEIRSILKQYKSEVMNLIRYRIGGLTVDMVASGAWRQLNELELALMFGRDMTMASFFFKPHKDLSFFKREDSEDSPSSSSDDEDADSDYSENDQQDNDDFDNEQDFDTNQDFDSEE